VIVFNLASASRPAARQGLPKGGPFVFGLLETGFRDFLIFLFFLSMLSQIEQF
jgi:hypothetical protein